MALITLDLPTARRELAAIVKGRESYVYDGQDLNGRCYYMKADGSGASCVIGHLLAKLGATYDHFRGSDPNGCPVNNLPVRDLVGHGMIEADDVTITYLEVAQTVQDAQSPWGEAFTEAEQYAADATA